MITNRAQDSGAVKQGMAAVCKWREFSSLRRIKTISVFLAAPLR